MGADIHFYVEKYNNLRKRWISADNWTESEYADEPGDMSVDMHDEIYGGRNYDLFAILANVRNGYGFAGVDTGDGFKPIDMPRGLPSDVSPLVKRASDYYDADGHSHSYLTLEELKKYDWYGQYTMKRGVVKADQYLEWKKNGKPTDYAGGVMGLKTRHLTNQEMEEELTTKTVDFENDYTQVEWRETYASRARDFLTETIPKLEKMCEGQPESELRIVFWFDN